MDPNFDALARNAFTAGLSTIEVRLPLIMQHWSTYEEENEVLSSGHEKTFKEELWWRLEQIQSTRRDNNKRKKQVSLSTISFDQSIDDVDLCASGH